jgi:hypothetical protein
MLDAFQSGNKERKETFSYHIWHFAAETPDGNKCPNWNDSPTLDSLTWETLPFELEKVSKLTCRCRTLRTYVLLTAQYQIFDDSRPAFSHIQAICCSAPILLNVASRPSHKSTCLIELSCRGGAMVSYMPILHNSTN